MRFAFPPDHVRTAADARAAAAASQAWRCRIWGKPDPAPPTTALKHTPVWTPPRVAKPEYPPIKLDLGRITVRAVLEATTAHFGITVRKLLSSSRKQPLIRRRQIAMYVAHKLTGRSYPFIAAMMGGRDHTTILHAVKSVQALIDARDAGTVEAKPSRWF